MTRSITILALASASLLAACSTTGPIRTEPAAPAQAGGGSWAYVAANRAETAKLAYGIAGTDAVGLMFQCALPQVRLIFFPPEGEPAAKAAHMTSGKTKGSYPLSPPKADGGYPTLEARLAAADPVLNNFAATGQLTLTVGRDTRNLDTRAERERAAVRAFRGACAGPKSP